MSGSLKRALGLWIAGQVDGLTVVSDELANRARRYPEGVLTEIARDLRPLGCGNKDFTTRAPSTGYVDEAGRMHLEDGRYRLTVSAPSGHERAGQEIVDGVLTNLERAVLMVGLSGEQLVLTDTETEPPEPFELDALRSAGRQPVPVDISGEPFVYRGALSLRVIRTLPIAAPVEAVIERIHVEGE